MAQGSRDAMLALDHATIAERAISMYYNPGTQTQILALIDHYQRLR
jgi:hypothetical protein